MQSWFTFELNGAECRVDGVATNKTLAQFLADRGTWPEGPCFAPTDSWAGGDLVLLATIDAVGRPKYRAVDATLLFLPMMAGQDIWTWEAFCLMDPGHTVVRAMRAASLECGPRAEARLGLLLVEGYYRQDLRWMGQLREQLDGIVTRTANWRAIERVARQIFAKAERMRHEAEQIAQASGVGKLIQQGRLDVFDDIFSRHLVAYYPEDDEDLSYVDESKRRFYRPKTLVELLQLKNQYPDAEVIAGGTGMGQTAGKSEWETLISTEDVEELRVIRKEPNHWEIGAAVTLTSVGETVGRDVGPLGKLLSRFASRAVRNRATLGGNLAIAATYGQIAPLLIALDARVHLTSLEGERDAPMAMFFDRGGKSILRPGEVIRSISVPRFTESILEKRGSQSRLCDAYMVTLRRSLCEPLMTGAFAVELAADGTVKKAWIAYSGVSDRPLRARKAEKELVGRKWNEKAIMQVLPSVNQEIKIEDDRGNDDYRRQLVITLFQKFYFQHPKVADDVAVELGAASEFAHPEQPFFDALALGDKSVL